MFSDLIKHSTESNMILQFRNCEG